MREEEEEEEGGGTRNAVSGFGMVHCRRGRIPLIQSLQLFPYITGVCGKCMFVAFLCCLTVRMIFQAKFSRQPPSLLQLSCRLVYMASRMDLLV
jgi:hypothetical protein